jgi:phosphotransferase system IIA component
MFSEGKDMEDNKQTQDTVKLNGEPVSRDQLAEKQRGVNAGERIVEVSPGEFKTLKRMQG